jgi:RNA polymerase sigma-70 factor (TIGR02947 family)
MGIHCEALCTKIHTESAGVTEGLESAAQFSSAVIPLLEPLYLDAVRMASNQSDAEDLLQDTVLKAYAHRHSFRPDTNLKAWLRRIMSNTYIDSYRKTQRQPRQYPTDEITDRQLLASAARWRPGMLSAEDRALEMLPDPHINAAMMSLPEKYRVAVYLADVEGLSYKEIAEITAVGKGTVTSRLYRGRQQLRRSLIAVPRRRYGTSSPITITGSTSGAPRHRAG